MMRRARAAIAIAIALPALGCAAARSHQGHARAAELARERLDRSIPWAEASPEAEVIDTRVRALLNEPLTAERAVEIALLRSPRLRAELERIGVTQAEFVGAALPDNLHLGGGLRFPLSGGTMGWEFDTAINLLQMLVIPLRRKLAKAELNTAVLDVGHAVLTLDADVRRAFYTYVASREQLELRRDIAEMAELAAELAARQLEAGTLSDLEAARQRAEYQEHKIELTHMQAEVNRDREALNRVLGLWGDELQWQTIETLPKMPVEEPDLGKLEEAAVRTRLDLAAARAEVEGLRLAVKVARANPFVNVEVGFNGERDAGEGTVGLGPFVELEIPIFDWGQADVARGEARLRMAQYQLRAAAIEARADVRERRNELVLERRLTEYQRKVVLPQRREIVGLAQTRYDAMLLGTYELLELKQQEVEAHVMFIQHLRDYWLARTELELAVGGRLEAVLRLAERGDSNAPKRRGSGHRNSREH